MKFNQSSSELEFVHEYFHERWKWSDLAPLDFLFFIFFFITMGNIMKSDRESFKRQFAKRANRND